ncbi:aromatic/alkene monooxygenase hydroxylase subunit beta [Luteithermobacter gelatinilyticus]|uniref:aromatic/alkene monooxygenase hydroxylase subunit beta n=1 Tax=Luteithermobacter gelatinilyticus TaxID=2582913 RepID=UPI0011060343|nr:aromatic/alkene monooxygenase hydroxylase subunit beta [Luteithermobacter gelatinilyticus]
MSLDIKTNVIEPRRQTYAHVAQRLGADKPASRYQEATWDVQATANFHYRPTWAPERELYDVRLTAIQMDDWYRFNDPRQFYYGTYTMARNKMMETEEANFKFVEKRGLLDQMDDNWKEKVAFFLLPLRHYEWGGNMNGCNASDKSYGTAINQVLLYAGMDRLGIAQIISRIGLLLDGNSGDSLTAAKTFWMEDERWQPLRRLVEDSLVIDDWFEQAVAQFFCMDGVVFPLVYDHFDQENARHGGAALSMLNEFMIDWYADEMKWVDRLLKVTAAENAANAELLTSWVQTWGERALEAARPLAFHVLGDRAETVLEDIKAALHTRARKVGLAPWGDSQ